MLALTVRTRHAQAIPEAEAQPAVDVPPPLPATEPPSVDPVPASSSEDGGGKKKKKKKKETEVGRAAGRSCEYTNKRPLPEGSDTVGCVDYQ
jgi:hypothetical protein